MMDTMETDPFYKHIGTTLRRGRESLGLTQGELAQLVGLSRTSLTNIELGRQRILVDQLAELANALHIPFSSLIPERSSEVVSEEEPELLESLPSVSDFLNAVRSHDKIT
jgi:transcriptional regulator with XRE-family HTH domain